jgi:nitrate/nitrite-specific signal transduction histidine kinase
MGSLEEKVSYIEAKVEEQGKLEQRLEHRFDLIDHRFDLIDQRFVQVDQRFARVDERFAQVDQRFAQVDQRFAQIDQRFAQVDERFAELRSLITALDQKSDRRFIWLVGMQFTTLIAIIAGMFTIFTKAV